MRLFLVCVGVTLLLLAVWLIPPLQASRQRIDGDAVSKLEPKDRVQLDLDLLAEENRIRLTLAQIVGGLALLSGLYLTWRNIRVTEEGKLTDRFGKAVELLGSEYLDGRIGGIYALERIARDSLKDHWTVMEVLTAFVREQSKRSRESNGIRPDIQAALTVIARRRWHRKEVKDQLIDLSCSYLPQANLRNALLRNANLDKAHLDGADFGGADLTDATLIDASLDGADLRSARLGDDNIVRAHRGGAKFENAALKRAMLGSIRHIDSPDLRPYGYTTEAAAESRLDTPVGIFTCYDNGTFLDVTNNLMWIRAFWGMKFDGERFRCQPVNLSWFEATRLFGYGGIIPVTAGLRAEDIKEKGDNEYEPGRWAVDFAGRMDWRLPTAKELLTLSLCASGGHRDDGRYDGYRHFRDAKSQSLREQLFPDCPHVHAVWSANENGECGWCLDGHDSLGDHNKEEEHSVLLVRSNAK